jgi:phospholipid transport system transporter-binding protein
VSTAVDREFQLSARVPGTLGVSGTLSFDTAAAALQAIQSAVGAGTVAQLDLGEVRHSDSAGLACVLAVVAAATGRGRALQVIHMPAGMRTLAQVCDVDHLILSPVAAQS